MTLLRSGTRKPMALFVAIEGFEDVISTLIRDGHRVCSASDVQSALQWFSGNLVDVLVCGAPTRGFDAVTLIVQAAQTQPQCERILLAGKRQWSRKPVVELSSSGAVHRVIHLPINSVALQGIVEEALGRRHISDEYSRLSHEVEVAERELLRAEEERRRLSNENKALQAQERQGYLILQEVLAEVPWPVFGVDDHGLIVMANDVALQRFGGRGAIPGNNLAEVLPEAAGFENKSAVVIDGLGYICRWRQLTPDGSGKGRLLLLEEVSA
jgi:PAS domain-containing protein